MGGGKVGRWEEVKMELEEGKWENGKMGKREKGKKEKREKGMAGAHTHMHSCTCTAAPAPHTCSNHASTCHALTHGPAPTLAWGGVTKAGAAAGAAAGAGAGA